MKEYENILEELKAQRELSIRDIIKWFEFVTIFNSNDFNYFLEFLRLRSDDMKGYMGLAAKILGLDKVEGHEIEIFKFIFDNVATNAKAYHLTNSVFMENIKENGLGAEFKVNKDFEEFYSSLKESTQKKMFPFKRRDNSVWCYTSWPLFNEVFYGDCPEWFFFLSDDWFTLTIANKDGTLEKSISWFVTKMQANGEPEENIEKGKNLLKKYWPIFAKGHKILVIAPLVKSDSRANLLFNWDNWVKEISGPFPMSVQITLMEFLESLANGNDKRTREYVSSDDIEFFDMESYELIEDDALKK